MILAKAPQKPDRSAGADPRRGRNGHPLEREHTCSFAPGSRQTSFTGQGGIQQPPGNFDGLVGDSGAKCPACTWARWSREGL